MSRFSKLEFDVQATPLSPELTGTLGTPTRSATDYLQSAHAAARCGNFEESLQLYTRCLREDRSRIPAWVGQVQMLIELREYQEAQLWAAKALELFKNNGDLWSAKAQALTRLNDSMAAAATDAAIKSPGSSSYRWQVRGEIMLSKDTRNARRCFEQSITEPDADWFDRVRISAIYLYHNQPAAAMEWAQAATRLEPAHGYVYFTCGRCQQELGLDEAAAISYARALQLLPRLDIARERLAHLADQSRAATVFRRFKGWFRK